MSTLWYEAARLPALGKKRSHQDQCHLERPRHMNPRHHQVAVLSLTVVGAEGFGADGAVFGAGTDFGVDAEGFGSNSRAGAKTGAGGANVDGFFIAEPKPPIAPDREFQCRSWLNSSGGPEEELCRSRAAGRPFVEDCLTCERC
ncbi:hypothetical protein NDU88_008296 [Pleurodeles waltl]|uniref:Uncharacterized protein n=1 Tax=Pleurodeles waltl TaxID=8319 RepID=A0AAV7N7W5_PLEWA|nr:hypothetical protein NDU88_008296 [Pleurodeles waltl]